MTFTVVITHDAHSVATRHLLQHFNRGALQEDLCFGLWRPSTGNTRTTALIDHIVLPQDGDRELHGNVSYNPQYLTRTLDMALAGGFGVAFMHSHPSPGWQAMSDPDVVAERDRLAYPAGATGLPLVGLTAATDEHWSARFWCRDGKDMIRYWCHNVRIVGPHGYTVRYNDDATPPPPRRNNLRRTFDTWGADAQATISRLHIGIVGLGSVGAIVAESLARIGISKLTLIDPDTIEDHNLDRLLYATQDDVGALKVQVAQQAIVHHATAEDTHIIALPLSVHQTAAYRAALDCDILFSCVDRPVARDILNYVATAHLIPVVDGGVAVETKLDDDRILSAHWRAHIITPYHRCMRCNGQYNSSMVVMELDGSLEDPAYVANLPIADRDRNQNVFPFSLGAASLEVNLMLRYLLAEDWWPIVKQQDYQFVAGTSRVMNEGCKPHCSFRARRAQGDIQRPPYLLKTDVGTPSETVTAHKKRFGSWLKRFVDKLLTKA